MEEIHARRGLMNHLELLWPHQCVSAQEVVQRSITHVLHHYGGGVTAQPVDGHDVRKLQRGYLGRLVYYSPAKAGKNGQCRKRTLKSHKGLYETHL